VGGLASTLMAAVRLGGRSPVSPLRRLLLTSQR
jgi:hypothetical protein